jgi:uncharacterized protein YjgD (DUF1641 family)
MSNKKQYLVMVDQNHREKLSSIAEKLQAKGCQIEQIMDKLGIVAVSVEAEQLNGLDQLEGVAQITSGDEQFHAI